jgi:hypothetical protein
MKPFQVTATRPPIVVMHGAPGIGKTTTAAKFPNSVFIQTEDGCPNGLTISSFGLCDSFASVIEALTWLGKETHDYQTLVIDSLDAFEPLVQAALCADRGYASVESPGFGKGYVELDKYWLDFLRGCNWLRRHRNMIIVMIAHSEIIMINDPRTAAYSSYALRLHKRARGLVEDNADLIGFLATDIVIKNEQGGFGKTRARADGGNARWLYCDPRPAFTSKNRFGMPERIQVPLNFDYQAMLGKFFPTPQPQAESVSTAAEPKTAIETEIENMEVDHG